MEGDRLLSAFIPFDQAMTEMDELRAYEIFIAFVEMYPPKRYRRAHALSSLPASFHEVKEAFRLNHIRESHNGRDAATDDWYAVAMLHLSRFVPDVYLDDADEDLLKSRESFGSDVHRQARLRLGIANQIVQLQAAYLTEYWQRHLQQLGTSRASDP